MAGLPRVLLVAFLGIEFEPLDRLSREAVSRTDVERGRQVQRGIARCGQFQFDTPMAIHKCPRQFLVGCVHKRGRWQRSDSGQLIKLAAP
jgi:hypothetical protein